MGDLMIGLLSVLMATNQPAAMSNLVARQTGLALTLPNPADPVEREYRKLLAEDDAAQAEVDAWIKAKQARGADVNEVEAAALSGRVKQRLGTVRAAYEDFLKRHPNHARARLAFGSFLNDIQEEYAARDQWEKARELDPTEPAAWNNLANWYAHNGPVTNAFKYYLKALELRPHEAVYFENLAITLYMFRRDAAAYFNLSEQEIFDKSMLFYRRALELDPDNFVLASHYAQSYYGFKPRPTSDPEANRRAAQKHFEEAIAAWVQAYKLAGDDVERQGVHLHFARLQIEAGRFDAARTNLSLVTNALYTALRSNLTKKLFRLEAQAKKTNVLPATPTPR
jgi:tetratricopeptide (TPR) repeat protein